MTKYKMRYVFGSLILGLHFLAIVVYVAGAAQVMAGEQLMRQVALGVSALGPLTLTYAMIFFRYVVANPRAAADDDARVDWPPFAIQLAVILLFGATLIGGLVLLFYDEALVGGYEGIQTFVSVIETGFAAFIGLIFSNLFPLQWEAQRRDAPPADRTGGGAPPAAPPVTQ